MGADESTIVLRLSLALHVLETIRSIPSIVVVATSATSVVAHEVVFLIVAISEELKGSWVSVVANGAQDHIVALLKGTVTDVLHGLNERQGATISSLSLFLEVHGESMFVIEVVTTPEAHRGNPEDGKFGRATPNIGHLVEQFVAPLLTEVSVAVHGRM